MLYHRLSIILIFFVFIISSSLKGQEIKKTPLVDFNFDSVGNFGVNLTEESYKLLQKQSFGNVPIGKGVRGCYVR